MAEQDGDKSQEPTPHRRQEAREKGQMAQSQDLTSAILLIATSAILLALGPSIVDLFLSVTSRSIGGFTTEPWTNESLVEQWRWWLAALAKMLLPLLFGLFVVGVGIQMAQVGILFLPQRLAPDIQRIDPLKGMQRILSLTGLMRLTFGIIKIGVVATVALLVVIQERDAVFALADMDVPLIGAFIAQVSLWTCLKVGVALLLLAILDYAFQYWKQEQELRMTSQEVKEEMRNLQGDPQVIARRRAVQRQIALNRLASDVPKADVVVTNPTELAIAIQYDQESMEAPVVVAKGAGLIAKRIREIALENGVPVVERKPLAQSLYRDVDVGKAVPAKLYAAVAEVLAYVYQLKGKNPGRNAA